MTVHLLGVRHHGPGSARSVLAALDELQPTIVLIESPAETTSAFEWVGGRTDADGDRLEPPVALLGYVVDDPHRAVFAPLAGFSPEWQAIRWANDHGVPVEAIDLPLAVTLAAGGDDDGCSTATPRSTRSARSPRRRASRRRAVVGGRDRAPRRRRAGVRRRRRGDGAVRSGTVPSRTEERREAHMRKRIRAAITAGHDPTTSSWCAERGTSRRSTSRADRSRPRPSTTPRCAGSPKVKVAVSWVPWTHERLAAASGYGAGVRSPAGTTTCSGTPDPTVSPGSSSTPHACCVPPTCRRRPTT
jgi:hypothetical protein